MNYSLIVPYFKTPEVTRLCLYSIFKFSQGNPEVIVVDNAPDSPESAMLKEFPDIKLIKNRTELRGSAANFEALDIGLQHASHDLVGLIHSDTIFLHDGWDLECFGRLESKKLAVLSTFEREANPLRPLRKKIRDWWHHLRHVHQPGYAAEGKLMMFFFLTRLSTLKQSGFVFLRDGHITPAHLEKTGLPVEVLSLVEISRLMWHTSNITSILTGQMTDPSLVKSYQTKREQLLHHPYMVSRFGEILAKHKLP
jgi:hypothetical protein